MSVISITKSHQLGLEELTVRVNQVIGKLEQRLGVKAEWENATLLQFRRKGASGSVELSESQVEVTVRLGIMFRALKGMVAQELESELERRLV